MFIVKIGIKFDLSYNFKFILIKIQKVKLSLK